MCFNAFDQAADLDVLDHPVLNFIYYLVIMGLWMLMHIIYDISLVVICFTGIFGDLGYSY